MRLGGALSLRRPSRAPCWSGPALEREGRRAAPGWRATSAATGPLLFLWRQRGERWDPPPSPEDGAPRRLDAEPPETARDDPAAAAGACVVLGG